MKLYHEAKIEGIFIENSGECDATYLMDQLEYYVTFKLADEPTLDGNKLIDEFFTRYYGTAAAPMKALYCRIEDLFGNPKNYPPEIQHSEAHQHQNGGTGRQKPRARRRGWPKCGKSDPIRPSPLRGGAREAAGAALQTGHLGLHGRGPPAVRGAQEEATIAPLGQRSRGFLQQRKTCEFPGEIAARCFIISPHFWL